MPADMVNARELCDYFGQLIANVDFARLGAIIEAYEEAGRKDEARELSIAFYTLHAIQGFALARGDASDEAMDEARRRQAELPRLPTLFEVIESVLRSKPGEINLRIIGA